LREEQRLLVFENRVLRRIFEQRRDEVTGGWRELHNEQLRNSYSSPNIIRIVNSRRMTWVGHLARTFLVTKPEGNRALGRLRRRWVGNIKMDLRDIVWGGTDWSDLAQDMDKCRALVNAVMYLQVP
jgi:hypothetical protein